jgi:hypothetical protein
MSLGRRVKKLEESAAATCLCQSRPIRFIHGDEPYESPADDGLKDGRCTRCGRIPLPSVIRFVDTERD